MSEVCKREPCDIKHENIQCNDKLWVYYHSDRKFKLVSRTDFPKIRGTLCKLCPTGIVRKNGSLIFCQTKVDCWNSFKSHLSIVERIFAEKVAFPGYFKENELPDISNYNLKYRQLGQLGSDLQNPSYYIFDISENKFIYIKREDIGKRYTKDGVCGYCPCPRKLKSPVSFLSHIQGLENKYFCYLVLEDPKQNDKRNQEKINIFLSKIKEDSILLANNKEIKELLKQQQSFYGSDNKMKTNDDEEYSNEKEDNDQSSEYLSINGDFNDRIMETSYSNNYDFALHEDDDDDIDDPLTLLNNFEKEFKNDYRKISNYFTELKSKVNICSLDQSLINSQEELILDKNDEDLVSKEKNLSFTKNLNLDTNDLHSLFLKHGVPESFRLKNISLTLNLNLKPKDNSMINNDSDTCFNQSANLNELTNLNQSTENNESNGKRPQRAKRSMPFRSSKQLNNNSNNSNSSIENNEPSVKKIII